MLRLSIVVTNLLLLSLRCISHLPSLWLYQQYYMLCTQFILGVILSLRKIVWLFYLVPGRCVSVCGEYYDVDNAPYMPTDACSRPNYLPF